MSTASEKLCDKADIPDVIYDFVLRGLYDSNSLRGICSKIWKEIIVSFHYTRNNAFQTRHPICQAKS